jgi:hypothetical protein
MGAYDVLKTLPSQNLIMQSKEIPHWTLDAIGSPAAYRILQLTSLSFRANMIALACSAALPTIGSMITLMNETGTFHEAEAPYHKEVEALV